MKNFKKMCSAALALCMIFSLLALVSCNNEQKPDNDVGDIQEGRVIIKTEIIQGELWITYADAPDAPVNAGRFENHEVGTEGLEYHLLADGTYGVSGGNTNYLEEIVIPSKYNGKAVTVILENAFSGWRELKSVSIPSSVTKIEKMAFSACVKLESIVIPSSVESLGFGALSNCSSLASVQLSNSLKSIGQYVFMNDISLKSVSVPKSVTSIDRGAFDGCTITITCEASSKPDGWHEFWCPEDTTVNWGK